MLKFVKNKKLVHTKYFCKFLNNKLFFKYIDILIEIGNISSSLGYNIYLVGGIVRDAYTYSNTNDIDIVVEGNAIQLSRILAKKKKFKIYTYKKFCTARIKISKKFKIDIVSSRREYYKNFFFIPFVEIGSIKLDFKRRDFTVNSLAIQLNLDKFGLLIDLFFARKDIKNMILRLFHNVSFYEDPSRIFRILKIKHRMSFKICKFTLSLLNENAFKESFIFLNKKKFSDQIEYLLKRLLFIKKNI